MNKAMLKIVLTTAASVMAGIALAQTAPSPEPVAPPTAQPPATQAPANQTPAGQGTASGTMAPSAAPNSSVSPTAPGSMVAPAPSTTGSVGNTGGLNFISQPSPNQIMASHYIGKAVYGANNERVGDINDMVVDASGNPAAIVIGVGGFLGIGEKNVAVPFSAVKLNTQDGKETLSMSISKRDLENAPAFKTDNKRS